MSSGIIFWQIYTVQTFFDNLGCGLVYDNLSVF